MCAGPWLQANSCVLSEEDEKGIRDTCCLGVSPSTGNLRLLCQLLLASACERRMGLNSRKAYTRIQLIQLNSRLCHFCYGHDGLHNASGCWNISAISKPRSLAARSMAFTPHTDLWLLLTPIFSLPTYGSYSSTSRSTVSHNLLSAISRCKLPELVHKTI